MCMDAHKRVLCGVIKKGGFIIYYRQALDESEPSTKYLVYMHWIFCQLLVHHLLAARASGVED